jgi:uncharacterized protein YjbI with pentapeptide repeats
MLITQLKSKETIESLAKGKIVIINCHGCKEVYFAEHEADELQKELAASKEVTQIITTDYICNADNLKLQLKKHMNKSNAADTILVFSCGVGVQTVAKEFDDKCIEGILLKENECSNGIFSHFNFNEVIFMKCNFQNCNFANAFFNNCSFLSCDFSGSSFDSGYFDKIKIEESKLSGCVFNDAKLNNVIIEESNFLYANFMETTLQDVSIDRSAFVESFFDECKLKNLVLEGVDFTKAEFFKTKLSKIDFRKSTIDNIRFSDTHVEIVGMIVDTFQAASLTECLGIKILN